MTAFIYVVGYLGYRQPSIFAGELWPRAFLAPRYQNSTLTPSASRSLLGRVLEYVEEEKPYLDNELRLSGLADQLGMSLCAVLLGSGIADKASDIREGVEIAAAAIDEGKANAALTRLVAVSNQGKAPGRDKA